MRDIQHLSYFVSTTKDKKIPLLNKEKCKLNLRTILLLAYSVLRAKYWKSVILKLLDDLSEINQFKFRSQNSYSSVQQIFGITNNSWSNINMVQSICIMSLNIEGFYKTYTIKFLHRTNPQTIQ